MCHLCARHTRMKTHVQNTQTMPESKKDICTSCWVTYGCIFYPLSTISVETTRAAEATAFEEEQKDDELTMTQPLWWDGLQPTGSNYWSLATFRQPVWLIHNAQHIYKGGYHQHRPILYSQATAHKHLQYMLHGSIIDTVAFYSNSFKH